MQIFTKGMIPIAKNIIVVDEQGNEYEATYPKRAIGLVKNGRARFTDENKICLTCPPNKNLEDNKMNEANISEEPSQVVSPHNDTLELTMNYVLSRIDKIINDTEHIQNALSSLTSFEITDGCGDVANQAKSIAIGDVVKCRETTNQQTLKLLEKMYDDLKNQKQSQNIVVDRFQQMMELLKVTNWDEYTESSRTVIEQAITAQLSRDY